ncbi:MAG: PilN domain-containing protein [Fuerstiella sp.]
MMNKRYSNLLSSRFRLLMLIRRRVTQWSVIWIAAVAVSLGWWQLRSHRVRAAEERVALMETRYSPLKQMQADIRKMKQQLEEMNSHESLLTRLDDEQVPYRLLALVTLQVDARAGAIRLDSYRLTRTDPVEAVRQTAAATAKKTDAEPAVPTRLTVRGIAADNLAVSLFVAGLRDTGVFESVDLKSSVGAQIDRQRAQSFIIDCSL